MVAFHTVQYFLLGSNWFVQIKKKLFIHYFCLWTESLASKLVQLLHLLFWAFFLFNVDGFKTTDIHLTFCKGGCFVYILTTYSADKLI